LWQIIFFRSPAAEWLPLSIYALPCYLGSALSLPSGNYDWLLIGVHSAMMERSSLSIGSSQGRILHQNKQDKYEQ
jgi:hypothetical protein